jgi:hypothetical protein
MGFMKVENSLAEKNLMTHLRKQINLRNCTKTTIRFGKVRSHDFLFFFLFFYKVVGISKLNNKICSAKFNSKVVGISKLNNKICSAKFNSKVVGISNLNNKICNGKN